MGIIIDNSIDGVCITPLKVIQDERGAVLHMLRSDSPLFNSFGEIYFSEVNPGVIKGWKKHKKMTQYFAVPFGHIKLVIVDDRCDSVTRGKHAEYELVRPDNYSLVRVPPNVWYAFQNIGSERAILANCADLMHDQNEAEHKNISCKEMSYEW